MGSGPTGTLALSYRGSTSVSIVRPPPQPAVHLQGRGAGDRGVEVQEGV